MKYLKPLLLGMLALVIAGAFSACNTIQGAGKDIEKAGDKIEDAAKRNK